MKFLKMKVFNLVGTKDVTSDDESCERIFQIVIQSMDELIVRDLNALFLGKERKSLKVLAEKKSLKNFRMEDSIGISLKLMTRFLEPIPVTVGTIGGARVPF